MLRHARDRIRTRSAQMADDALRRDAAGKRRFCKAAQGMRDWMRRVDAVLSSPLVRVADGELAVEVSVANRKRNALCWCGHATNQPSAQLAHDARGVHRSSSDTSQSRRVYF